MVGLTDLGWKCYVNAQARNVFSPKAQKVFPIKNGTFIGFLVLYY